MKIRDTIRAFALLGSALAASTAHAQLKSVGDGTAGPFKAQHLTVELQSLGPAIAPGGTQIAGLVFNLEEHWHVYWLNAGDSGEPPKIAWTLPSGITASAIQFPIPKRLPLGPLMDFGYENHVGFPVTLTASPTLKPGKVHLDARVDWLVCAQVCIPGKAHLGLDLNVQPGAPDAATEARTGILGESLGLIPKPLPPGAKVTVAGSKSAFVLTLNDGKRESHAEFYPADKEPTDLIAYAAPQPVQPLPDGLRLTAERSPDLTGIPAMLHGILKLSDTLAYEVSAPIVPGEVLAAVPATGSTASTTTLGAIGLAFLGGIILNLMPCVFPVLFLKGLALVQSAGETRKELRLHGIVYTLGILVSFWAIVAVLLVVRAGGSHAGWGFQLQSPTFLTFLASGIFFFALSLAGLFDIGLSLTSVGGELAQKQGYTGSFFTGVLATVVATPCTAPLMGAAIGFALAQSAGVTFAVFTALALGLAAPYLALSFQPAWTKILPRPGAWMETFKQLTAAIFFATVIWLAWVYGQLFGSDSGVNQLAWLLTGFLVLAIAGWVLGKWPARWASTITAVLLIALGLAVPLTQARDAASTASPQTTAASSKPGAGLAWAPYSQQALDAARAAGHPVFIDFTAAWCLSCQFNERAVLKSPDVEHELTTNHVTLLKADWTKYDPAITAQLAAVNRSGVPTYVLYPAQASSAADVLPELLTKSLVLDAIRRDTKP